MYQMLKKGCSSKNYTGNDYKPQVAYDENTLYKRSDNITFNNTRNISKNINQHTADAANNYENQQSFKSKKTYPNCMKDVAANKCNTTYTNDNTNVTRNK